ncbi:hypothetical protein LXL04_039185 [Taraxacum kok-saghyz]
MVIYEYTLDIRKGDPTKKPENSISLYTSLYISLLTDLSHTDIHHKHCRHPSDRRIRHLSCRTRPSSLRHRRRQHEVSGRSGSHRLKPRCEIRLHQVAPSVGLRANSHVSCSLVFVYGTISVDLALFVSLPEIHKILRSSVCSNLFLLVADSSSSSSTWHQVYVKLRFFSRIRRLLANSYYEAQILFKTSSGNKRSSGQSADGRTTEILVGDQGETTESINHGDDDDDDSGNSQKSVKKLHFGNLEEKAAAAKEIKRIAGDDWKWRKLMADLGVVSPLVVMLSSEHSPTHRGWLYKLCLSLLAEPALCISYGLWKNRIQPKSRSKIALRQISSRTSLSLNPTSPPASTTLELHHQLRSSSRGKE